ncbi:MAG: peptidoglycan editing factor PgeF [Evtepia sp.]|uniref:peptidoglycan editing factor PgeF n=1 Tax=Evtepia sp. TaxID=2773933 RepID=UPI002A76301C|nr:peptidoglycan editing factor PgeF [Evtepia sp.]MDY3015263.1 peptidoglycan editing factor PgeF [Evtepia sp.]
MAFTKQSKQNVIFHTADAFTAAGGVAHGFATRLGGVSTGPCAQLNLGLSRHDDPAAVRENYRRFCAAVGTDPNSLVMTHQVHEDTIRVASREDILPDLLDPIPYDADGLITNDPGLCLTIYYADCIPVLLYDPEQKVIAAVHSGWRGTALGIAPQAAEKMADLYGCKKESILAAIGPGIGPCCFETHDDVPSAMTARWGSGVTPYLSSLGNGKFSVDLKGILAWQLRTAGLTQDHIDTLPLCTACHPELYWSHRKMGDQRGNQAAMIQLRPSSLSLPREGSAER